MPQEERTTHTQANIRRSIEMPQEEQITHTSILLLTVHCITHYTHTILALHR